MIKNINITSALKHSRREWSSMKDGDTTEDQSGCIRIKLDSENYLRFLTDGELLIAPASDWPNKLTTKLVDLSIHVEIL